MLFMLKNTQQQSDEKKIKSDPGLLSGRYMVQLHRQNSEGFKITSCVSCCQHLQLRRLKAYCVKCKAHAK